MKRISPIFRLKKIKFPKNTGYGKSWTYFQISINGYCIISYIFNMGIFIFYFNLRKIDFAFLHFDYPSLVTSHRFGL